MLANWMAVLATVKILFLFDVFINLFLCYLIVVNGSNCYYESKELARAPKIIMVSTIVIEVLCWGAQMTAFAWVPESVVMALTYGPYLLLALYIVYCGVVLLRYKAYKTAALFGFHGVISAVMVLVQWIR